MEYKQYIFISLWLGCTLLQFIGACPERCFCSRNHVRCMFINSETIPQNIPGDTTLLDFRFNKIKRIPRGSFPTLPNLNTLLLNNNELEEIEEDAFQGLPELRFLYLYKNKISKIHPNAFRSLSHLEQLSLHSNLLTKFPEHLFDNNPNLKRLRLDSNSLMCDCDMMWLADMLKEKQGFTQAAVICKYPSKFQGRSLMAISKEDFHCEKPKITMEPKSVDVTFGNTVYFSCRAEGDPQPEITWLHNDNVINPGSEERYKIMADGTLMIEGAQDSDKGFYECMARNAAGMTKANKVELRYLSDEAVMPKFMEAPSDVSVIEGDDVVLPCQASGKPRPEITWNINSEPVTSNIRMRTLANGSLSIINIRVSDAGRYVCQASNSVQTITTVANVRVLVRPVIVLPPDNVRGSPGATVSFNCQARGDSQPVLYWSKDGSPLPNNGRFEILRNGETLRINSAVAADQGTYTCKAENAAGSVSANARLFFPENVISVQPSFSQSTDLVSAVVGNALTIQCVAEGRPEPIYEWIRDGRVIHNRNRIVIQGGILTINGVNRIDAGRYDCVAENSLGRATKSVFLQVEDNTVSRAGDRFVSNAVPQATQQINYAINVTRNQLFNHSRVHSVQDLISAIRYPSPESLDFVRAEEIFEQTLDIIYQHVNEGHKYNLTGAEISYQELVSPGYVNLIANLSGCLTQIHSIDCSDSCFHRRYRTLDGTCNNFQNPTWGAANTAFIRLLPPIYENGFNSPVGWNKHKLYRGTHLPSARLVSSLLMSADDQIINDDNFTHMLMQWGQFLDHDLDLSPQALSYARFSDGRNCNETCENTNPCFPIPVPASDPRITEHSCLGFTRSSATCNTDATSLFYKTLMPRQQLNALTAFIDGSMIYGSNERFSNTLRNLASNRGLLREGPSSVPARRLLPFDDEDLIHRADCQLESNKRHVLCFLAGDHRANEQLALTAFHTLWMRQHNHIATGLQRINPHWDGNKIFFEARKIIGAIIQHISYKHWLPKILGPKGMTMLGNYTGYKPDVNPSIANEFATAALRFGHTLIQPLLFRLNESFQEIEHGHLPLHKAFFAPYRLIEEGGIDPLIRGLFGRATKKRMPGEFLNSELTEKLFMISNAIGQDLASLNVQRGRDHGLQFYNDYRELCGLKRANRFEDLHKEIQFKDTRDKLHALYGHPDNIDLFIGGISETMVDGAKVGPTFLCILTDQFKRLRDGDRFWYEREGIFTQEQMFALQQTTIATAICDSSDGITQVQKDVFMRVQSEDEYVSCNQIPRLDLSHWTDCCEDCRSRATLSAPNRFRGRRSAEYSYPDQRPVNTSTEHTETPKATETVPSTSEKMERKSEEKVEKFPVEEETQHCEREDVDLLDSRLEGMEETMMEMAQIISQLKKKIQVLETTKSSRHKQSRDHSKKIVRKGEHESRRLHHLNN
ncbi:peroxidasin homolog [Biomphalaria glabrata]|uniref:Peroxidasin homolog n=1 Tax=Biomphalaria glabrata TaxID=6526 RepID=A0A9W3AIL6_BIOGL|nr:peroxidasin homolog [Biomphalaria glabrata]